MDRCRWPRNSSFKAALSALLIFFVGTSAAWGQSLPYHLERLGIQAEALSRILSEPNGDPIPEMVDAFVEAEVPAQDDSWSRDLVLDDLRLTQEEAYGILEHLDALERVDPDSLLDVRNRLETLQRRFRVSTAALQLTPSEQTALDLTLLELKEASRVTEESRQALLDYSQRQGQPWRGAIGIGAGWGAYPWGWAPWGSPLLLRGPRRVYVPGARVRPFSPRPPGTGVPAVRRTRR